MRPVKCILFAMLLIRCAVAGEHASRGDPQNPLGEGGEYCRWNRSGHIGLNSYPFINEAPSLSQIPLLFDWIESRKSESYDVPYCQLMALSRVDFRKPALWDSEPLFDNTEFDDVQGLEGWKRWWSSIGQTLEKRLRSGGRRNPAAWKLVAPDRPDAIPSAPVTIPDEWLLRTWFSGGDYAGVTTESLCLRRTAKRATLIRASRRSTHGKVEWEQWLPLTTEQADNFAFATAYVIDQPWTVLDASVRQAPPRLEGRGLSVYYPKFRYEFADRNGDLWWNDDPWKWYANRSGRDALQVMPQGYGSVCVLLARTFPDASSTNNAVGWRPVKSLEPAILDDMAEDLAVRADGLMLVGKGRVWHALDGLAEFGTRDQLPAISRFESDLRKGFEKVPNTVTWKSILLTKASDARAAIQKRIVTPE
jgi:hypothetical protein